MSRFQSIKYPSTSLNHKIEDPIVNLWKCRIYDIFISLRYKIVSDVILQILEILICIDEWPLLMMQQEIVFKYFTNYKCENNKILYKDGWIKFEWCPISKIDYYPAKYTKYSIHITGDDKNMEDLNMKIREASDQGTSYIRYSNLSHFKYVYIDYASLVIYINIPTMTLRSV